MFNAGVYDPPPGSQGYRRLEHFVCSSFIVLDFDNGRLSPKDFVDTFSGKSKKGVRCSFLIFNTFSRSPAQPNRFRAVMFYTQSARSPEEHRAVFDWVKDILETNGFPNSGLDQNSRAPNQSYFMPCTNRAFSDWAFFEAHNTRTKAIPLYGIDPSICFEFYGANYPERSALHRPVPSPTAERIAEIMRPLHGLTEGRHRPMFITACRLAALGLLRSQVQTELRQYAGQERHLQRKVGPILRSVDRYRLWRW
jgi:hypothetical protein